MAELIPAGGLELFGFKLEGHALAVVGDPTIEDCVAMASYLGHCERVTRWAIGDLLNEAERRHGETYTQIAAATGLSEQFLMDCKWLSNKFEISRRREISWSHHREVASLDAELQDAILDRAASEKLSRARVREIVQQEQGGGGVPTPVLRDPAPPSPPPLDVTPPAPPPIPEGHVRCAACDGKGFVAATAPAADPSEVLLTFPCNGKPAEWLLMADQVSEWVQLYPGIDVLGECRKALAWVKANRRKTAKGMPRFLNAWLARVNDRTPNQPANGRSGGPTHQGIKDWLDEEAGR